MTKVLKQKYSIS